MNVCALRHPVCGALLPQTLLEFGGTSKLVQRPPIWAQIILTSGYHALGLFPPTINWAALCEGLGMTEVTLCDEARLRGRFLPWSLGLLSLEESSCRVLGHSSNPKEIHIKRIWPRASNNFPAMEVDPSQAFR